MNRADASDDIVTVSVAPDLSAAQVIRSHLQAEGIDAHIPDEHLASMAWPLTNALGGIRVQVHGTELEAARRILHDMEAAAVAATDAIDEEGAVEASEPDDRLPAAADAVAQRAFRAAILGTLIWPLLHPWSLSLAWEASTKYEFLSRRGRRWMWIAFVWSTLALLLFFFALSWMSVCGSRA